MSKIENFLRVHRYGYNFCLYTLLFICLMKHFSVDELGLSDNALEVTKSALKKYQQAMLEAAKASQSHLSAAELRRKIQKLYDIIPYVTVIIATFIY